MLERYVYKNQKKMRCGYTTGTCACAAAKAAACMLLSGRRIESVSVITPMGVELTLPVYEITMEQDCVTCAIKKDSGDDPDVTNGILIYASVSYIAGDSEDRKVVTDGGTGVGRVTKKGLSRPGLCTPDESYHGITYAEKFGKEGAFITKCTSQLMRDLGCIQSPQNAFILNLGLESLHVRMPRHVENGQAVAEFLEKQDKVEFVNYPGLPSNKYYETAKKYMPDGGCGVVSFELKGGREAAEKFMKNLKLAAIETHVADARTCCLNPATSTHRQMNDEQLAAAGIPAGLIRISCGLEDKKDLIADIAQALEAI